MCTPSITTLNVLQILWNTSCRPTDPPTDINTKCELARASDRVGGGSDNAADTLHLSPLVTFSFAKIDKIHDNMAGRNEINRPAIDG